MQFLTPLFWLGLLGLAVPLWIHLVHREKTTRIPFASLMFLRRIPIRELQRRKLTRILLLCLRCLGLLLLILAFSRPVVQGFWINQINPLTSRSLVILVDHSLSMSPLWEEALEAAEEKVGELEEGDEAILVQFGETAQALSTWETSRETLLALLRNRLSPSFQSTSYLQALRFAVEQFGDAQHGRREICLITDLQQTGLSGTAGWKVPEGLTVEIISVGEAMPNLFVEEVRLEREVFTDRYPHPILVRLGGRLPGTDTGEAQLFVNGTLVERRTFQLEGQGTANLTFNAFPLEEGVWRGRVVVQPTDLLPVDNVYNFVVERRQPWQVVLLTQDPGPLLYFENALSSGTNLPFLLQISPSSGVPALDPGRIPVVILNDLDTPPRAGALRAYLEAGGGLVVALGNQVRAAAYRGEWAELLGVELVERRFVRQKNKSYTSITEVSWDHPIFSIFQDLHKSGIVSTQFYSYWRLKAGSGASVIARFNEGDPALVELAVGRGKVLVFASSLDTLWTDFPLRSAYLPFWFRTVQYAASWRGSPAALRVNQVLPVESGPAAAETATSGNWNVIDPQGQRVIQLNQDPPGFIRLEEPGHYEIRSNKMTNWVAVNSSAGESNLERITEGDFLAAFVPGESRTPETSLSASLKARDEQQSLWWLFLLAAALVFLAESMAAGRGMAA